MKNRILFAFFLLCSVLLSSHASFAQHLQLPATGLWNGFNGHINAVECTNVSGEDGKLKFTVIRNDGEVLGERTLYIQANAGPNIVLNEFSIQDQHGTYIIEQIIEGEKSQNLKLSCITAIYRLAKQGANKVVEYAFALPVTEPLTGVTTGIFNSINPEGGSGAVYNWLSVYNPSQEPIGGPIEGVVQLYDQAGNFLTAFSIDTLAPGDRVDFPIMHEEGQSVGLYRISLFDLDAPYGAFLTRYSERASDIAQGTEATFNFAFPLFAQKGVCDSGPVPASTMDPATNWGEIANPTLSPIDARIEVRNSLGQLLHEEVRNIASFAQEHLYLNQYLGARSTGTIRVTCLGGSESDERLIVQSLFYGHALEGASNVEWAYASQARVAVSAVAGDALIAPVNTFLNMSNWLKVWNETFTPTAIQRSLYGETGFIVDPNPEAIGNVPLNSLAPSSSIDLAMHELAGSNFVGTVTTSSITSESLFGAEILRVFPRDGGGIGYIMPVSASLIENALTANAQTVEVPIDSPKEIHLTASNEERDTLSFWVSSQPGHGILRGRAPNVTYIPDIQYIGTDEFSFRVSDGTGSSRAGKVLLNVGAWKPSIGVAEPSFGINQKARAVPQPWNSPTPGFYYVDREHPSATDVSNLFGVPSLPRMTIPNDLPAGAVVELHGRYDFAVGIIEDITGNGTPENPIFIRGASPDEKPFITKPWHISGSYMVLENLEFGDNDDVSSEGITGEVVVVAPAHHVAVRYSEVRGNQQRGGINITGFQGLVTNDIVIYSNEVSRNGEWWTSSDNDPVHAVRVWQGVNNVWIARNNLRANGGNGVHIDAGSISDMNTTHHIYVSENSASNNRFSGYWVRHATDVVLSQNVSYDHRPTDTTRGACLGYDFGPQRLWVLYNELYNCEIGIAGGGGDSELSDSGPGDNIFIVGNVIHEISNTGEPGEGAAKDGVAISLADSGPTRFVINNTVYDAVAGIVHRGASGSALIANNILSFLEAEHIYIENPTTALASIVHNTLLHGSSSIRWGSVQEYNTSTFIAAFPGQCANCREGNPRFENTELDNFHLQAQSIAIDGANDATLTQVFDLFESFYATPISSDFDEKPRMRGSSIDMGAFEFQP